MKIIAVVDANFAVEERKSKKKWFVQYSNPSAPGIPVQCSINRAIRFAQFHYYIFVISRVYCVPAKFITQFALHIHSEVVTESKQKWNKKGTFFVGMEGGGGATLEQFL